MNVFTILVGLAAGMLASFMGYHLCMRRNRKVRALDAERADAGRRLDPPRYQAQGQAIELTTPRVHYSRQQHSVNQPSARHDGPDVPPAYSA